MTDPALDLDIIEAKWLQQCGACDASLPMTCTHPAEDYRPTMAALVAELRHLRGLLQRGYDAVDHRELRHAEVWPTGPASDGSPIIQSLRRDLAERDQIEAEANRQLIDAALARVRGLCDEKGDLGYVTVKKLRATLDGRS
jgi:hypothetical protein